MEIKITKLTTANQIQELAPPCKCKECEHGCRVGTGFLIKEDIPRIAKLLGVTEEKLKEKYLDEVEKFNTKLFRPKLRKYPFGQCIFFDEKKKCTVHKAKPFECRTAMGCKDYGEDLSVWFTLNHFVNPADPESIRQWKIYLESGGKLIPEGELSALVPNRRLLKKILSYEVLK